MTSTVGIPVHAADVAAVVTAIPQGLCELGAADTCQPVLDIIAVSQLVRAASMKFLGCHTAEGIVCIACQGHFRTAQFVPYRRNTVFLVISIGIDFCSCCLTRSGMFLHSLHFYSGIDNNLLKQCRDVENIMKVTLLVLQKNTPTTIMEI